MQPSSITFTILTHDEGRCIKSLVKKIESQMWGNDSIVLVDDESTDLDTIDVLEYYKREYYQENAAKINKIRVYDHPLNDDFAAQKNFAATFAYTDYIVNIDADEDITDTFVIDLKQILMHNPNVDVFLIPRRNRVSGLTNEWIERWGWNVNSEGLINWPDHQWRVYKNLPEIKYINKVHETLSGHKCMGILPDYLAINHDKTIEKQISQNNKYNSIQQ